LIKTIGVLGAGIMGAGITQVAAQTGLNVIMRDITDDFVSRGLSGIKNNLDREVQKNRLSQEDARAIVSRIKGTANIADMSEADFVIEAVMEKMELKREVYGELDKICLPTAIFASNTSGLSITEMASATSRPNRIIGMHFFNPVPVMKLVEIIKGTETDEETVRQTQELAEKMGKEYIMVTEAPLFVVNRILVPMINDAIFTLMEGVASAEDIDKAMRLGANHPIGPLALADLVGLDTVLLVQDTLYKETGDSKYRPCALLRKMVRAGHLGRKTGRGFYNYK
jgi:3-hydroxybutyryl-CoA dehydrogenase